MMFLNDFQETLEISNVVKVTGGDSTAAAWSEIFGRTDEATV
jgi:hypothetical protein